MSANVMLVVERMFPFERHLLFRAFTDPVELSRWRGPKGWHVDPDSVRADLRVGGRHHHVKVNDEDPSRTITTDAVFTEFFDPDVFVAAQRISGADGIDPDTPLELRVEFTRTGRDGTLVRVVQGPYDPSAAGDFSDGWESELEKLDAYAREESQR